MKIAIFVSSWPPGRAATGIVTYTEQLVTSLRAFGHEVYIVTHDCGEKESHTIDLQLVRLPLLSRIWQRLYAAVTARPYGSVQRATKIAKAVQQLVDEKGIEVFEIEESFGMSLQVSRLGIVPVLVRLHGPFLLTGVFDDAASAMPFNNGRAKYEGRAIKIADYITAPCKYARAAVRRHYDFTLPNSSIIPTPIASAPEEETWRIDRCNKNTMLFVGRFDSIKGGDLVLRAFARLAQVNPELRLTFVGPDGGIQTETGTLYFEEFFAQSFPPELRTRVDFRGQMGHADLMALRASHYLTLIAARYDTMGYMLLEAMSFGCPLVTTAVGGIVEVIQNEHNGLLVPSLDQDEIVDACQRLLDDPELAARLGRQAWLDCRELYNPNAVATQTVEAYNSAIEAFRAKRSA